jgi:hypothetical protein
MGTAYSHYKPVSVGVNATVEITSSRIGGFIPTVAGTWTFTIRADGAPDVTLPAIIVPAENLGIRVDMPIYVGSNGRSSVTTSGGASGILLTA